jgi:cytochrome bd-type quinol oxidase subunit 2
VENFWENHGGQVLILVLAILVLATLMVLVPQLLRSREKRQEMQHLEHMRALEQGLEIPPSEDPSWAAGMTAMLVPMVVVITAGTVTCFLAANRSEQLFAVAMAVWGVAGVVSLAAITGGVALIGRLAQLRSGQSEEEEMPHNPLAGKP